MEQALRTPRTAHTARPVTATSGRYVRLGTVSGFCLEVRSAILMVRYFKDQLHCVSKNVSHCNCLYQWQILTDFQNLFLCMILHCIKSVFVDIWCVERWVYFWLSWLSRPTTLSTVGTFSSVPACFSLSFWRLWSTSCSQNFLVACPVLSSCFLFAVYLEKIPPEFSTNCFFWTHINF